MKFSISKILTCFSILLKTSTNPKIHWVYLFKSIFLTVVFHPESIFSRTTNESKKHFLSDYLPFSLTVKTLDGIFFVARPKFEDLARFLFSKTLAKWEPLSEICATEGQIIVDIGANVGYYTIPLSKMIGPSGKIISIEPDPKTFEILKKNCSLNNLNNVILENTAVGNKNGVIKLFSSNIHSGTSSIIETTNSKSVSVQINTLDKLLSSKFEKIDWIKIDVEGYELFVLQGSTNILKKTNQILIEIHENILSQNNQKPEDIISLLENSGFKIRIFEKYWDKENSQNQSLKSDYILGIRE